jgi:hypothetical protein
MSQTLIATSNSSEATANHNQRKIVRDSLENVYVVFVDSTDQGNLIKGLWMNNQTDIWSSVSEITKGTNPSISIDKFGKFNLVYESNDSNKIIMYLSSMDFTNWTEDQQLSDPSFNCQLPICESDSDAKLSVFWIKNLNNSKQTLIYANILDNIINLKKSIITKSTIKDIAIASHLQNFNNEIIFSLQFDDDSLQFLKFDNELKIDTLLETKGKQPCISYNSTSPYYDPIFNDNPIRLLFIDNQHQLIETECGLDHFSNDNLPTKIMDSNKVDYVCIDDVIPPFGYSFLFMKNENLYHGFSYGAELKWKTILDTISTKVINPSIAYKNFNSLFIDYIWMEKSNYTFNIFYKRDSKYNNLDVQDNEIGKEFKITGYPNPFNNHLKIEIELNNLYNLPILEIYDLNARKIKTLLPSNQFDNKFTYNWDTINSMRSGLYFIKCSVGDKSVLRKVIKQ